MPRDKRTTGPLTAERLRDVIHYDPLTGRFVWLKRLSYRGYAGQEAGNISPDGYRRIGLDGEVYQAHRLAWLYMTGEWPDRGIDHQNTQPGDNIWTNLRLADHSKNGANSPKRKGANPYKGVAEHRTGRWMAGITVRRQRIYLGLFDTPEQAHAAYVAAAKKHFGEFARAS